MQGKIFYLSPTYPGGTHDCTICKSEGLEFEKEVPVFMDLGFLGIDSEISHIIMHKKKKKNQILSEKEKITNQWISKVRVRGEHVLDSVKSYRIVRDVLRYRLYDKDDSSIVIACAIHNLKLKAKFP